MTNPATPDSSTPATEATASDAMPRLTARSLTLAMIGLVAVITLMFISYTSGFGHPQPRNIPIAVSGPPRLQRSLNASPALAVTPAGSPAQARRLVLKRHVYGALALSGRHAGALYVANGAGHSVEVALEQIVDRLARKTHLHITAAELAPTSPNDPNGTVEFYCVVFLAVGGALGASIFARIHGSITSPRQLLQRTLMLTVYTALAAAAYLLFIDTVFGALTGHPGWLFLALWGYTLAVALAASGISALLGTAAGITLTLLFTLLGNPSAGGAIGRPLLNPFFAALTPIFPHGGGISVIRGIQYFHGAGITAGILCLTIWGAGGAVLLVIAACRGHTTRLASPAG